MMLQLIQEKRKKIIFFLASKEKNFDGNQFVNQAFKNGASISISEKKL